MNTAIEYAAKHGIATESDYPYTGTRGSCKSSKASIFPNSGDLGVTVDSVSAMESACAQQPVSIAIEADKLVFQLYNNGVLTSSGCGTSLDHGVLMVGYDTTASTPYYIVKNSWGADWGEDGYVRLGIQ